MNQGRYSQRLRGSACRDGQLCRATLSGTESRTLLSQHLVLPIPYAWTQDSRFILYWEDPDFSASVMADGPALFRVPAFILPQQIARLALQNPKQIYTILFRAASETLLKIAADSRYLGASIEFLAVLHTWGQNLHLHPHLHCVVPGGGISPDGSRWIACRRKFFLPVRVLSRLFRKKFLKSLRSAFRKGDLRLSGELASLKEPAAFRTLCHLGARIEWVVYAKPPFGGPERVLKYLARYTHRVAISNHRLQSLADGRVSFGAKDYADRSRTKTVTLDAVEFIRRFLLHVLPSGFVRIRQFGFLSNRVRQHKLELCRVLLGARQPALIDSPAGADIHLEDPPRCSICKLGRLILTELLIAPWIAAHDTHYHFARPHFRRIPVARSGPTPDVCL